MQKHVRRLAATRIALGCFDPIFLTVTRATLAGCIGLALLLALRQRRPDRSDLRALAVVAFGVVIGFPLLSALALRYISSAHSLVLTALLPLATAIFGVLRAAERPRPAFWLCAGLGTAIVSSFALARSAEVAGPGDLLMLAAIILAGLGYAEGAKLTRRLGGWQVICWALVAALPLMAPLAVTTAPASFAAVEFPWPGAACSILVQHAHRLRVLVSRPGARRHRNGRTAAAVAAIFRSDARRQLFARNRQ